MPFSSDIPIKTVKSTHIRTFPSGFLTMTVGEHEHYSVDFSTGVITFSCCILCISNLVFSSNGVVIRRGEVSAYGLT